ncbi:MAG: L-2-hydroxyglutarate oxidase [Planctomycetes bacterium]|nr:L-2-hydroxyglutarate oxidase [Planctomycetota bacterium]
MPASGDVLIVGGGIVGLATAYQLASRFPDVRPIVLEKENRVSAHQSGRNSGVLHSGIYYKPGSLKAVNCRSGKAMMEAFCAEQGIAHEICGKVIVAVSESELPVLKTIFERGRQNGVRCEWFDGPRLREREPHAAGIQAIHVPEAGIVDFRAVCERLRSLIEQAGGTVALGARVTRIRRVPTEIIAELADGREFPAAQLVNCAGLHSDRVVAMSGARPASKIVPFRGEYYELLPEARGLCRHLIYPVPDPNFPFLGVHFTRMVDGSVECGPNAVLAFAREGYRKLDVNLRDLLESLTYSGFLRLCARHWRPGLGEIRRSFSKRAFVHALRRLIPDASAERLVPGRAGVRAQALAPDGSMIDDFQIIEGDRAIHVCNAPSPAATSSLRIGESIVDRIAPRLD